MTRRSPCKDIPCWHCKAEHTQAHYERVVYNKTALWGPWEGWRMAGRDLVAPSGDRICCRRLTGILWVERSRIRKFNRSIKETTSAVVIPARELFAGSA